MKKALSTEYREGASNSRESLPDGAAGIATAADAKSLQHDVKDTRIERRGAVQEFVVSRS